MAGRVDLCRARGDLLPPSLCSGRVGILPLRARRSLPRTGRAGPESTPRTCCGSWIRPARRSPALSSEGLELGGAAEPRLELGRLELGGAAAMAGADGQRLGQARGATASLEARWGRNGLRTSPKASRNGGSFARPGPRGVFRGRSCRPFSCTGVLLDLVGDASANSLMPLQSCVGSCAFSSLTVPSLELTLACSYTHNP
jgi:hypothetical protein